MTLLLDMNISPKLLSTLAKLKVDAMHWHIVGDPTATDTEIVAYAKENNCIVVTYERDNIP